MEIENIIPNKYNKNVYEFSPIEERNEIHDKKRNLVIKYFY